MESILEQSKRRIDNMLIAGTVERFAESVELVCEFIGIPIPRTMPENNVGAGNRVREGYRSSGKISQSLATRIDEITTFDRQLYDYAVARFEARLSRRSQVAA